jgi:hypothetical protein
LALRVGCIGSVVEQAGLAGTELHGEDLAGPSWDAADMLSGVWCTMNNQLRTGTDKGNLTV